MSLKSKPANFTFRSWHCSNCTDAAIIHVLKFGLCAACSIGFFCEGRNLEGIPLILTSEWTSKRRGGNRKENSKFSPLLAFGHSTHSTTLFCACLDVLASLGNNGSLAFFRAIIVSRVLTCQKWANPQRAIERQEFAPLPKKALTEIRSQYVGECHFRPILAASGI